MLSGAQVCALTSILTGLTFCGLRGVRGIRRLPIDKPIDKNPPLLPPLPPFSSAPG